MIFVTKLLNLFFFLTFFFTSWRLIAVIWDKRKCLKGMFFFSETLNFAMRLMERRCLVSVGSWIRSCWWGPEFQIPEVKEKLGFFSLHRDTKSHSCFQVLRGLRENGESPKRKAKGYGFLLPAQILHLLIGELGETSVSEPNPVWMVGLEWCFLRVSEGAA